MGASLHLSSRRSIFSHGWLKIAAVALIAAILARASLSFYASHTAAQNRSNVLGDFADRRDAGSAKPVLGFVLGVSDSVVELIAHGLSLDSRYWKTPNNRLALNYFDECALYLWPYSYGCDMSPYITKKLGLQSEMEMYFRKGEIPKSSSKPLPEVFLDVSPLYFIHPRVAPFIFRSLMRPEFSAYTNSTAAKRASEREREKGGERRLQKMLDIPVANIHFSPGEIANSLHALQQKSAAENGMIDRTKIVAVISDPIWRAFWHYNELEETEVTTRVPTRTRLLSDELAILTVCSLHNVTALFHPMEIGVAKDIQRLLDILLERYESCYFPLLIHYVISEIRPMMFHVNSRAATLIPNMGEGSPRLESVRELYRRVQRYSVLGQGMHALQLYSYLRYFPATSVRLARFSPHSSTSDWKTAISQISTFFGTKRHRHSERQDAYREAVEKERLKEMFWRENVEELTKDSDFTLMEEFYKGHNELLQLLIETFSLKEVL